MRTYKLIACALLAALAFFLQISNEIIGIPTGFGMTVDLAAVPVLIALFVFGAEYAMMVLALLALIILGVSPTGYIGALMKLAATIPMVVVPYLIAHEKKASKEVLGAAAIVIVTLAVFGIATYFASIPGLEMLTGVLPLVFVAILGYWMAREGGRVDLSSPKLAFVALFFAAFARSIIMTLSNLYFAGPVFFHVSPTEFITALDGLFLPLFGEGMGWFVIFFWNMVQSAVEFTCAWIPAYHFGLVKRHSE